MSVKCPVQPVMKRQTAVTGTFFGKVKKARVVPVATAKGPVEGLGLEKHAWLKVCKGSCTC